MLTTLPAVLGMINEIPAADEAAVLVKSALELLTNTTHIVQKQQ